MESVERYYRLTPMGSSSIWDMVSNISARLINQTEQRALGVLVLMYLPYSPCTDKFFVSQYVSTSFVC